MKTKKPSRRRAAATKIARTWQIETAEAHFKEGFRRARREGPQRITRQGHEGVIIIAHEHYERLVAKAHKPSTLVQSFRESPLVGLELDLQRDRS